MIRTFERMAREYPKRPFFHYVDAHGTEHSYTYQQTKQQAAGLALALKRRGVGPHTHVAVDMENCPAFVFSILAAAYGGFCLVLLNNRLTSFEKENRLKDLQLNSRITVVEKLTERGVEELLDEALDFRMAAKDEARADRMRERARRGQRQTEMKERRAAKRRGGYGYSVAESAYKPSKTAEQSSGALHYREIIHFAERARAAYQPENNALIMFTSGTTGKPKAVPLTWSNICDAAKISNRALNTYGEGSWQAVLPMYHIGGLEVPIRSLLNGSPFILYQKFDPVRILDDACYYEVSHLSVVDKMLQDLIAEDTARIVKDAAGVMRRHNSILPQYECILLGGGVLNQATLEAAMALKARVFASFGMTETSSQVAHSLVQRNFNNELQLLPGYEAKIIDPDQLGFGQLAIKGPGVFTGYLNSKTPHTVDGFFLTGDTAALTGRSIIVRERVGDMFVSGGENVYPAEIQQVLLQLNGVTDAYVFGVEDATWGKRPVGFIERHQAPGEGSPQQFTQVTLASLGQWLSRLYYPKHLFMLDKFPRTGVGKTDRLVLQQLYDQRIEIKQVNLYRIDQPLVTPFITAKTTMESRESLIVEVVDWQGRTGIAECVAFSTDWYLSETLDQDQAILENHLIPLVLSQVYLHPSEVSVCLDEVGEAINCLLAKGALEPALWDLYGKIVQQPLWHLIGGEGQNRLPGLGEVAGGGRPSEQSAYVVGGVALGITSIPETLEIVGRYYAAGYRRIKLKIKPGDDIERVCAVRREFPNLILMLDANQSYTEQDIAVFHALDAVGAACIEEPLDPLRVPMEGPQDILARLARLQQHIHTPICLDESLVGAGDYVRALGFPQLQCYTLKIAKLGGIQPALAWYRFAHQRGATVWMGGMVESSVSKRMHAAFQTLPGIDLPGDISETTRYFAHDIATPSLQVEGGSVLLNAQGHEYGLGCALDREVLTQVLTSAHTYSLDQKNIVSAQA